VSESRSTASLEATRIRFGARVWLLALLLSCLGAFAIGEAALRLLGVSFPVFWRPDAQLGFALQPNEHGWYRAEGEAYVVINREGMRDKERSRAKPNGTFRIALLGDSMTEAVQVPLEHTLAAVMEQELRGKPLPGSKTVEVLNFGVSGYGTAQQYLQLRHRVWEFQPDAVVLAVTTANDIRNNSKALEWERMRPFFDLADGKLVLDESFRDSEAFRLRSSPWMRVIYGAINASRVLQLVREGRNSWTRRQLIARQERDTQGMGQDGTPLDEMVFQEPVDTEWKHAWSITERLLLEMRDEVARHKAKFFVVITTNGSQVMPAAWRARLPKQASTDWAYPNRRVAAICREAGIQVLDLAPPLRRYVEEGGRPLHGFSEAAPPIGHWNADGHRQAALQVAAWLAPQLGRVR
jgi:lysophospholipase L1-like esterase